MVTSTAKSAATKVPAAKKSAAAKPAAVGTEIAKPVLQAPAKPARKKAAATVTPSAAKAKVSEKAPVKAAAKPAGKSAARKPARAVTAHVDPATVHLLASTAPKPHITLDQRHHYVSVAAFYIAERRGFTLGNPAEDWLAAEAEVDRLIASGHFTP